MTRTMFRFLCAVCAFALFGAVVDAAPRYDVVLRGGTVVDPETELQAIRNVGITGGKIAAVSEDELDGVRVIDAAGLIVAPGFIDLHAHGQNLDNSRFQVMDGVTSALEMEIGVGDVDAYYAGRAGESMNNYGATVGHVPTRIVLYKDPTTALVPRGPGADQVATPEEIQIMADRIAHGLKRGAVGVGFGLQYTPAASRDEVHAMFRVAAEHQAACFVHIRHFGPKPPTGAVNAVEEVFSAAAVTGASLHIVHINSSGTTAAGLLLRMIGDVRSRGIDVTTECYPYRAGMTAIDSALFATDWRDALDMDYGDLQYVETGERLTEETYKKYREIGGSVIMFTNPQPLVDDIVIHPLTLIASDGGFRERKGHPRTAGTYSKMLRRYVRELESLTLLEAIRKMSLMPAQRLQTRVPQMQHKGRLQTGADADVVVFDLATITDHSTYEEPAQFSTGMKYVFVSGEAVVENGELVEGRAPGGPIRAPLE